MTSDPTGNVQKICPAKLDFVQPFAEMSEKIACDRPLFVALQC